MLSLAETRALRRLTSVAAALVPLLAMLECASPEISGTFEHLGLTWRLAVRTHRRRSGLRFATAALQDTSILTWQEQNPTTSSPAAELARAGYSVWILRYGEQILGWAVEAQFYATPALLALLPDYPFRQTSTLAGNLRTEPC